MTDLLPPPTVETTAAPAPQRSARRSVWRTLSGYAVAVGATLVVLLATLPQASLIQQTGGLLLFGAVAVSSWYGGLGPGLLAALLAALSVSFLFLEPRGTPALARPGDVVGLAAFSLVAGLTGWLATRLQGSRRQARAAEAYYRALFEGSVDPILVTDERGRYVASNAA